MTRLKPKRLPSIGVRDGWRHIHIGTSVCQLPVVILVFLGS